MVDYRGRYCWVSNVLASLDVDILGHTVMMDITNG